jgi:hypothetical protein
LWARQNRERTAESAITQKGFGPLKDMKLVNLSHIMAGPACSMLLAEMGADVIKVEKEFRVATTRGLFFRCYRVDLNRLGLGVQSTDYPYLFRYELFRCTLVAQRKEAGAVIQTVQSAMSIDASHGALCVRRPHPHLGVIRSRAIVVRNDPFERLLVWTGSQRRNYEKI